MNKFFLFFLSPLGALVFHSTISDVDPDIILDVGVISTGREISRHRFQRIFEKANFSHPARHHEVVLPCPRGAVGLPTEGRECYVRLTAVGPIEASV